MSNMCTVALSWQERVTFWRNEYVGEWVIVVLRQNQQFVLLHLYIIARISPFLNEWVSDCCLAPQGTIFQLYIYKKKIGGDNCLSELFIVVKCYNELFLNFYIYIIARASQFLSEWVSDCSLTPKMYSIQHYVIKFVSDLRQDGGFLRELLFPPPTKLTATI